MNALANGHIPSDALGAAKYYLGRGLIPVPVPRTGRCKAPVLLGWPELRPSLNDLPSLFPEAQATNVGILLGNASGGLIDIDLDALEAVAAAPFLLPTTGWLSGRSGKQFSHWWYIVSDPPDKAQDKFADLDGTDLLEFRSTGGQTVAPPSVHETGESIVWHKFEEPAKVDCMQLLAAAKAIAAAAILARHWPKLGTRQDAFLALAGALLRAGWAEDRVEQLINAVAAATNDEEARKRSKTVAQTVRQQASGRNTTGWPKLESLLGHQGASVVQRAREWLGLAPMLAAQRKNNARSLPPYQPFPIETLAKPIADFVQQTAMALGCDPAFVALPTLSVAASVIGNTRVVRLKRGWDEPCVIWSVIVGDSGTLKSPAYMKSVQHLYRVQKKLLDDHKIEIARYERELEQYKEAKRAAKENGGDPGDPPERPIVQRIVCSDTTIEKLAEILEDTPRGTLLARDELAGWIGSFTRYKGRQGGSDLPNWLETFRAGTVIVDRKTGDRKSLFIPRAAVSVTGGIQPGVLSRALSQDLLDAGMGARLIMAMPPRMPKIWSEIEVDQVVEQAYWDVLDRLLALTFNTSDDGDIPHVLSLAPDAKAAWISFFNEWAQQQASVEGELAAAFSKLEGLAARFSLLHHVVTHVALDTTDLRPIGLKSVTAGIAMCRWFAAEVQRIYAMLSESDEERDARRLIEFIRARGNRITVRQLMRANCRRFPDSAAAESALAALVDCGHAQWIESKTAMLGGKSIKAIELCMTHDTDDTAHRHDDSDDEGGNGCPHDSAPDAGSPDGATLAQVPAEAQLESAEETDVIDVMRHATDIDANPNHTLSSEPSSPDPAAAHTNVMQTPYLLVTDTAGLSMVAAALDNTSLVGLDIETTGLNPQTDRVRLLSLALDTIDVGSFNYLIDCFCVDPAPLWELLADKDLVIHNAQFDLGFMDRLGFTARNRVHDTMLMAQVLAAGTNDKASLAACTERYLSRALDKAEQLSNWAGILTAEQLAYAAADIDVLKPLYSALRDCITVGKLEQVSDIETRCLPAIVWMSAKGVALDRETWTGISRVAGEEATKLRAELDAMAPQAPGQMFDGWNWDSPAQVQQALEAVGCKVDSTADWKLASLDHPLAALLRRYRLASKRATTYGVDWLKHVTADGRVYPHWFQIGAWSGRMSCSTPNMQQMPRGDYRRCVIAPPGRVLIKADYSQIELRLAAKIANEPVMIEAYIRGDDLHTLTARQLLGKDEVAKSDRQLAKALNFGLLYGMGARGLRGYARTAYGVELTEEQAVEYRAKFFRTYPKLAAWHKRVGRTKEQLVETWTVTGRRRLRVKHFTEKLNTPVQGSGADGLKLALALLWERRDQSPGAFPIMAVHDEIVVEADTARACEAEAWLKSAMLDAMAPLAKPVPVGVETAVSANWAGG